MAPMSDPLGPMIVYTQPEQPKIEEWLQITTDHIKITWLPPESTEGKFDQYYLNVTRRRERFPAVDFKNEFYHKAFGKNETFHVMKITAGRVLRSKVAYLYRKFKTEPSKICFISNPKNASKNEVAFEPRLSLCENNLRGGVNEVEGVNSCIG